MPGGTISGDQERKFCTRPTFTLRIVDVDPVVGEQVRLADHQRDGQEVAVAQRARVQERDRASARFCDQLAHRRRTHHVARREMSRVCRRPVATRCARVSDVVIGELDELAAHQHSAAALLDLARRRVPHHAGAPARIVEGLDQGLDDVAAGCIGLRLAAGTSA